MATSRKPEAVGPMVDDPDHHDVPFSSVTDDRVEEPPEGRQILDEEVLKPMPIPEHAKFVILFHDFTVKAVCEQD
jgi:hypothetical protein